MKKIIAVILISSFSVLFGCDDKVERRKELESIETPKPRTAWQSGEYTNEFNDSTGIRFLANTTVFFGKYSSSATTNSQLFVKIFFDKNGTASIRMYEDDLSADNLKRHYSDKKYIAKIREGNGAIHEFEGFSSTNEIGFPGGSKSTHGMTITEIFSSKQNLKVHIRGERREIEQYTFDITEAELDGFSTALSSMGYQQSSPVK